MLVSSEQVGKTTQLPACQTQMDPHGPGRTAQTPAGFIRVQSGQIDQFRHLSLPRRQTRHQCADSL